MSSQPESTDQANPWSSDGETVPQILCQSLIGIISILKYFSINYALKVIYCFNNFVSMTNFRVVLDYPRTDDYILRRVMSCFRV